MEEQIDLVYLWVDGNDPRWLEKKNYYLNSKIKKSTILGRYKNNDELKHSLCSVEKHIPWVRKIFIVTDNQVPIWLNVNNPKITIVDHSQIIPNEFLPTFNSNIIEYFIHKIPDLSEYFIFSCDYYFVYSYLSPDFFFKEGMSISRLIYSKKLIRDIRIKKFFRKDISTYERSIYKAIKLIKKKYRVFYELRPHHNIDAYSKSDYKKTFEVFYKEFEKVFFNRFRKNNDNQRIIFDLCPILNKRANLQYVTHQQSGFITLKESNFSKCLS